MSKLFVVLGIVLASALAGCGSRGETIGTAGGAVACGMCVWSTQAARGLAR